MKKMRSLLVLMISLLAVACGSQVENPISEKVVEAIMEVSPKEKLKQAYQLFKEGDDEGSINLANEVLEIGRASNNDTLIGKALTSLCRNSQRKLDTIRLGELSEELVVLSAESGDKKWLMYRAHMNAEMWRLIGNMVRAESFYNESMAISFELGAMGMYTIDHFNKSFVSTAKGDFDTAKNLIKKYYQLRVDIGQEPEDAYGLIALAYLLEQQGDYLKAHEVAVVTRRLFKEQNIFPEPPDEKPLIMVEEKVKEELEEVILKEIATKSNSETVSSLLDKYLK